jgi:predicted metal-dependent peptidase
MKFEWSSSYTTAATDGTTIWWNPDHFLKLSKDQRVTVLLHELWHIARLHTHRLGTRDRDYWNQACDIVINNEMQASGYVFDGIGLLDPTYAGMGEEEVYDLLYQQGDPNPNPEFTDLMEPDKEAMQETLNNVVRAMHEATQAGMAGSIPGCTTKVIQAYLKPVVPWERLLDRFIQELLDEDYSWSKPNRRYPDIYLPHRYQDEGKLQKLNYYLDVSGSIEEKDILRFNSEIKFIKDRYNPLELNLIQFDTVIQKEITITDSDSFKEVSIIGGGGTSLEPVRQHIMENKPTAAIIFSDLWCDPMEPLHQKIPIIWVIINNKTTKPKFGEFIRIGN